MKIEKKSTSAAIRTSYTAADVCFVYVLHFDILAKIRLDHNSAGPKNIVTGLTLPECIDYCSRRSWYDYALYRPTDLTCNTYERIVGYTLEPGVVSPEWKCAVKKR